MPYGAIVRSLTVASAPRSPVTQRAARGLELRNHPAGRSASRPVPGQDRLPSRASAALSHRGASSTVRRSPRPSPRSVSVAPVPFADLIREIIDLTAGHVRRVQRDHIDAAPELLGRAPNRSPRGSPPSKLRVPPRELDRPSDVGAVDRGSGCLARHRQRDRAAPVARSPPPVLCVDATVEPLAPRELRRIAGTNTGSAISSSPRNSA